MSALGKPYYETLGVHKASAGDELISSQSLAKYGMPIQTFHRLQCLGAAISAGISILGQSLDYSGCNVTQVILDDKGAALPFQVSCIIWNVRHKDWKTHGKVVLYFSRISELAEGVRARKVRCEAA